MHVLLSSAYLPGVEYMSTFFFAGKIEMEASEYFIRQTYRNRTEILSPNGRLTLSIPIIKSAKQRTLMKEVRISEEFNWRRIHWLSLESCYRRSPWFEFFEDEIRPFYEKKQIFLFDYNQLWMQSLGKMLGLQMQEIGFTESYEKEYPTGIWDLRHILHPKKNNIVEPLPYKQVFPRGEFHAGLSIIDLIMNEGRGAREILNTTWLSMLKRKESSS